MKFMSLVPYRFVLAALTACWLTGAASAETRFISMPDFLNIDIGDLRTLDANTTGDDDTGANSWTQGYEDTINHVLDQAFTHNPDFALVPGDLVMGWWDVDTDNRKIFGDTSTFAGKQAAIDAAGDFYYGAWKDRFTSRGMSLNNIFPVVGDHELGDNRPDWSGDLGALVPDYKNEFADHFTGSFTDTPSGPASGTAYAVQRDNVLIITLDEFEYDASASPGNTVTRQIDAQQQTWVEQKLADAQADATIDHVFLQGHLPIDDSPKVPARNSSQLKYDGGQSSDLWQAMVNGGADIYLAGEVHADSVRNNAGEDLLQIINGSVVGESNTLQYMTGIIDGKVITLEIKEIPVSNIGSTTSADGLWQTGTNRPHEDVQVTDPGAEPLTVGRLVIDKTTGSTLFTEATGTFAGLPTSVVVTAGLPFNEPFSTAVVGGASISSTYPPIAEYGDGLFGGVGVEDNAGQPGGSNGDLWAFFQSGRSDLNAGGSEAGIRVNLGKADITDGATIEVGFWLGEKENNSGADSSYTDEVLVQLTDGAGGAVLASILYTPDYDTTYSDATGGASDNDEQLLDEVLLSFSDAGLFTTSDNLFLDILFQADSEAFQQGLLNNLTVVQTPEPATLALLGLGGLVLAPSRRR